MEGGGGEEGRARGVGFERRKRATLSGGPLATSWALGDGRWARLEVDDDEKDEHGGHHVGEVGQILPVEGLLERLELVVTRHDQVEEGHQRALELSAAARVDGGGRESLPHLH